MSVQQPDVYVDEVRPWTDDEIDLRKYLMVLLAWWREILLITLIAVGLAAAGAWLWRTSAPIEYSSTADVVIARLNSQVELDARITTSLQDASSPASWRASLLRLAEGPTLAAAVLADIGTQLDESLRTPSELVETIRVEMPTGPDGRTASDIIRITATTGDPEAATLIANRWAQHFIARVNQVYGQVPLETLTALEAELASTRAKYLADQAAYEAFIAGSQIDSLTRRINEKIALRDNLQLGRNALLAAIADQDRNARLGLFTKLAAAQTRSTDQVLNQRVQADIDHLTGLYKQRGQVEWQLEQARNLVNQIEQGGEAAAASNAVALQMLKLNAFSGGLHSTAAVPLVASNTNAPVGLVSGTAAVGLNVDMAELAVGYDALLTDANALVSTLESYIVQLDGEIASVSDALLAVPEYAFLDDIRPEGLLATALPAETADQPDTQPSPYTDAILESYRALFDMSSLLAEVPDLNTAAAADPLQETIAQLDTELQSLRAQLAAEEARELQLSKQRDLAWTAYDALSNKQVELTMARTAANSEVRLGAAAVLPTRPNPPQSVLLLIVAAGLAAGVLAVVVAFSANALGHKPLFARS